MQIKLNSITFPPMTRRTQKPTDILQAEFSLVLYDTHTKVALNTGYWKCTVNTPYIRVDRSKYSLLWWQLHTSIARGNHHQYDTTSVLQYRWNYTPSHGLHGWHVAHYEQALLRVNQQYFLPDITEQH